MPKFKVGDRIAFVSCGLPRTEVAEVYPDGYTIATHNFDSVPTISRWDGDEADSNFEVPITREEHERILARVENDTHVLVCQAVTLLNNGETLNASALLREWLASWSPLSKGVPDA